MDKDNVFLKMITVYQNPSDYPGKFVAREHYCMKDGTTMPGQLIAVADNIEDVRSKIPDNLVRTDRHQEDDAVIVETWL